MFFKSATEKIYNLENKKQKVIKNLIKEDNSLREDNLNELINLISIYHINKFKTLSQHLYNNKENLVDVAKESKELLLKIFNINNLYQLLKQNPSYENQRFEKDDEFRRKIMNASLYQVISIGGKEKGPEYGLIYAKMFNYSLGLPMQYASYNGIYDERFIKYVDTYLGLGGSDKLYWLPNYFDSTEKNKYSMANKIS